MDKQTRISRIVRQFLGGQFASATEERVQRWLVERRDNPDVEAASEKFWESLDAAPSLANRRSWERVAARTDIPAERPAARPAEHKRPTLVRRWASIAAAIAVPLMAVAGGLIYYTEVVRPQREVAEQTVQTQAAKEAAASEPLVFDGATVTEIFAALEDKFGVTITADAALTTRTERYTVKFTHGETLEEILSVLGDVIGEMKYTKTGNNITITNK